jgi:hypothetical protein
VEGRMRVRLEVLILALDVTRSPLGVNTTVYNLSRRMGLATIERVIGMNNTW